MKACAILEWPCKISPVCLHSWVDRPTRKTRNREQKGAGGKAGSRGWVGAGGGWGVGLGRINCLHNPLQSSTRAAILQCLCKWVDRPTRKTKERAGRKGYRGEGLGGRARGRLRGQAVEKYEKEKFHRTLDQAPSIICFRRKPEARPP